MRLSIDKTHDKYLQFLALELDATPKEVINFLLWKLRESKYSFNGQVPLQAPQPARLENPYYDPNTLESKSALGFVPQSPQAIQEFEDLAEEIDPIIQKFINLGLVDQF